MPVALADGEVGRVGPTRASAVADVVVAEVFAGGDGDRFRCASRVFGSSEVGEAKVFAVLDPVGRVVSRRAGVARGGGDRGQHVIV